MDSLEASDAEARAVAGAPRVTLADIVAAIAHRYDTTADRAVIGSLGCAYIDGKPTAPVSCPQPLKLLSLCVLVMTNGFTVVGKSACASPENFNAELGKKIAYEDAVRQLWPLMGYALRDKLAAA